MLWSRQENDDQRNVKDGKKGRKAVCIGKGEKVAGRGKKPKCAEDERKER